MLTQRCGWEVPRAGARANTQTRLEGYHGRLGRKCHTKKCSNVSQYEVMYHDTPQVQIPMTSLVLQLRTESRYTHVAVTCRCSRHVMAISARYAAAQWPLDHSA